MLYAWALLHNSIATQVSPQTQPWLHQGSLLRTAQRCRNIAYGCPDVHLIHLARKVRYISLARPSVWCSSSWFQPHFAYSCCSTASRSFTLIACRGKHCIATLNNAPFADSRILSRWYGRRSTQRITASWTGCASYVPPYFLLRQPR